MRLPRSDSGAARAGALVHRHRPTLIALGAAALALALVGLLLAKAGVLPRSSWSDVLAARERYPGALLDAAGAVAFLARPVVAALTVLGASAVALLRFGPRWSAVVLAGLALGWAWLVPLLLLAARWSSSPTDHIVPRDAEQPPEHAAVGRDRGAGAGRLAAESSALRHDGSA